MKLNFNEAQTSTTFWFDLSLKTNPHLFGVTLYLYLSCHDDDDVIIFLYFNKIYNVGTEQSI